MRSSTSGSTPKTNTVQDDNVSNNNAEKTSGKKLKQARLPFKVIAPGSSPAATLASADKDAKEACKDTNTTDGRKRKLSYDDDDDDVNIDGHNDGGAVVILEGDDDNVVSKENVDLKAASKKKKLSSVGSHNDVTTSEVIVSLLDDDDDIEDVSLKDAANTSAIGTSGGKKDYSLKTPKNTAKDKRKGAGTPQTSSAKKDNNNGSASKLQIKLPLSAGKKKRRKSKLLQLSINNSSLAADEHNNSAQELSSDDIEDIAIELNPQKRKKLNDDEDKQIKKTSKEQEVETIALDSETEIDEKEQEKNNKNINTKEATKATSGKEKLKNESSIKKLFAQCDKNKTKNKEKEQKAKQDSNETLTVNFSPKTSKTKTIEKSSDEDEVENINISDSSQEEKPKNAKEEELREETVLSENEADDERDNLAPKEADISSDMSENSKSKLNNTLESSIDVKNNTSSSTKTLTSKQSKLLEQRRKAREEKERKLQEEKLKKQQEKEEKELAKKREREEKEDQRRKEREEKEEQKRKERDEKERKRLAEIEAKNEEKRKKNEAKEEELRKKDEERKRKEQEKEEAELKKKKAAQAFTKFFVAKTPNNAMTKIEDDSNTGDEQKSLAFRPFQVKGDMKLAPLCRKILTDQEIKRLDVLLGCRNISDDDEEEIVRSKPLAKTQLYLNELSTGKILPGKWRRPSTESKDDVILVEDELERVAQEIVEDTPAYIREEMRVKFYKFHDNRRPPFYGTWRKKSLVVKARKPFAQDKKFFDYEVDSDDEWEEEEPGESLEDGSEDDKEKESEDDDYEVDNEWFVPHGHLSDEELQNEDEFGMGDDNTREAQKAKLKILQQEFAQEMKKKTEKIKPRLIGCIWVDINGNQPIECANILWDTLEKKSMLFTEPPLVEEPEGDRSNEPSSPSNSLNSNVEKPTTDKLKPIALSDSMVKDLTRLIHGNKHSKNFLINEYLAFVEKTEESVKNGDLRKPFKSAIRDKIDEMAEWQVVDANACTLQDMEQANDEPAANATDTSKKKKKGKRRLCWVVKQEMLNKMDLATLELQNSWEYILPPKFVKADKEGETTVAANNESVTFTNIPNVAEDGVKGKISAVAASNNSATSQITKFTKVLTAEEKASKLQNTPATTNDKTITETKANSPSSSTSSSSSTKEKKRVPLLMSVARGQQIPTPAKNKLISQFLQQNNKDNNNTIKTSSLSSSTSRLKTVTSPEVKDDDVVILD